MLNTRLTLRMAAVAACLGGAVASSHAADAMVSVTVGAPLVSTAVYRTGAPAGVVSVGYRGHGGYGHGGYYRGGYGWGVGVGLGVGVLLASPWYYNAYPGVVVTQPSTVVVETAPAQPAAAAAPAPASRPDPVIYPRNGQSAQQLEADRQECNRWATTQAGAMTDSSIFMRAVDACMDGRGYTTK